MTDLAPPRRRGRTDPNDLRALLEYFTEMAAASRDVPEAADEHTLWLALAAELRAYLAPPAVVDEPMLLWDPG